MTLKSDERIRKGYEGEDVISSRCVCGAKFLDLHTWFKVVDVALGETTRVCSPSCLLELAWRLKEAQVKLSKSKVEVEPPLVGWSDKREKL